MKSIFNKQPGVCFTAIICCALWGSAFPFIKIGYKLFDIQPADYRSQILFAGIRFLAAGVIVIIFASILSKKLMLPKKNSIGKIGVLSLFQTVFQYTFFYLGLAHTTGTKASILNSTSVFFALIAASLILKQEKLSPLKITGCVIGFAGTVIINLSQGQIENSFSLSGEGFIIISSLSYALSSVFMKKYSESEKPLCLSGWQFMLGGAVMIIFGVLCGGRINTFNIQAAAVIIYLAVLSAAAYSLWSILLKYNDVSNVAVFGFMTPIFGCLFSALLLKETSAINISLTVISLLLVSLGIITVNIKIRSNKY